MLYCGLPGAEGRLKEGAGELTLAGMEGKGEGEPGELKPAEGMEREGLEGVGGEGKEGAWLEEGGAGKAGELPGGLLAGIEGGEGKLLFTRYLGALVDLLTVKSEEVGALEEIEGKVGNEIGIF